MMYSFSLSPYRNGEMLTILMSIFSNPIMMILQDGGLLFSTMLYLQESKVIMMLERIIKIQLLFHKEATYLISMCFIY